MKNQIIRSVIFISMVYVLAACSGGDGFESNNPNTRVTGTWRSACVMVGALFFRTEITFANGDFDSSNLSYDDSGCTNLVGNNSILSGPYSIGRAVTTTNGGVTAYELDVTVTVNNSDMTWMDLVRVEDSILYLSGQRSISVRPTTLDFNNPYMKQ